MEIHKLETFVDLAETLNYTETASRLYITQATVSKQIKSLETELDVTLFDRSHRNVTLTDAGRFSLPYAQKIVATSREYQQALATQRQTNGMKLRLLTIPSVSAYRAFNQITSFSKLHPEVEFHFAEAETATLLPALASGVADVVFTRLFAPAPAEYEAIIGEQDHFVLWVPKDHPLAQAQAVPPSALAHESLLMLSAATGLYQPVIELLADAQVHPKIAYTGQRIDLIAGMVNRGMGVAIMMTRSADLAEYQNINAVPLTPTTISHLTFMRLRGKHSQASDWFWDTVQQH